MHHHLNHPSNTHILPLLLQKAAYITPFTAGNPPLNYPRPTPLQTPLRPNERALNLQKLAKNLARRVRRHLRVQDPDGPARRDRDQANAAAEVHFRPLRASRHFHRDHLPGLVPPGPLRDRPLRLRRHADRVPHRDEEVPLLPEGLARQTEDPLAAKFARVLEHLPGGHQGGAAAAPEQRHALRY